MKIVFRTTTIVMLLALGLVFYKVGFDLETQIESKINKSLALQSQLVDVEGGIDPKLKHRYYELSEQIANLELKKQSHKPLKFLGLIFMDFCLVLTLSELSLYLYTNFDFTNMGAVMKGSNGRFSQPERLASMPVVAAVFGVCGFIVVSITVVWQWQSYSF